MTRRTGRMLSGVLLGLVLLLAACSDEAPPRDDDPPILTGFDALPKQIITIALTPTPTPVIAGAEQVAVAQPTATPGPPRPTATLTPYVGVFLGQPTSESGAPAPTLAPLAINPGIGSSVIASGGIAPSEHSGNCSYSVAGQFASAYTGVQARLGCPLNPGASVSPMVTQPFERGVMFWRGDTRQIYALASNGQFWQVPDTWNESMPADDPAFSPPGGLLQPVRGFGYLWRNNGTIREALGWALAQETQYDSFWQDFERGAMFLDRSGQIYALFTAEGQHSGPLG